MSKQTLEIRSADGVGALDDMFVEGYALKFNVPSTNTGDFTEIIEPGSLKDVDLSDVRCLFDHDSSKLLGRVSSGTLELKVDDVGLWFKCQLPNNTLGRDIYESVRRGDLNQCSFTFALGKTGQKWFKESDGKVIRKINQFKDILEVSLVSFPAYEEANVTIAKRSMDEAFNDLEKEKLTMLLDLY